MLITTPYGSWKSPITADSLLADFVSIAQLVIEGEDIYWTEMRAKDGGRMVIVRRGADGHNVDVTPEDCNVRTRVHEYGGGSFTVHQGTVYFSNFRDQRLYRLEPGGLLQPLTPAVDMRYADGVVDPGRGVMYAVREDHTGPGEAANSLVRLDLHGGSLKDGGQVIVSRNDFYSDPRLSPDGSRLLWLTWNHPNMPWDGTELWVGELDQAGNIIEASLVAGGASESIFQPSWSPDGMIYFVSDRAGWWNLYRRTGGKDEALYSMEAEFGGAQWVFGLSFYDFMDANTLLCLYEHGASTQLARLDVNTHQLQDIETYYEEITSLKTCNGKAVFIAGSASKPWRLIEMDLKTRRQEVLRKSREESIPPACIPEPQHIEFPTENGLTAYGYFYPPKNPAYAAPDGELPPLVVMSHGGPTSVTTTVYRGNIYYLTSRGLAVLDVDYGGSTGYGRAYRQRLNGNWGVMDVDDCANGAKYLVEQGLVDGNRLAITGSSAGGYTTLCALTFRDTFKAGSSHYGIGDLEVLARDTHKFESRYMDTLVGPYPEMADLYRRRSPIHYVDQLNCALILFQGLEDKIVPPNQAEMMFAAVKNKGLPVAYLPFEGEQHSFRKAESIIRTMEAELYFFGKVFGFQPADEIEPVNIENLD